MVIWVVSKPEAVGRQNQHAIDVEQANASRPKRHDWKTSRHLRKHFPARESGMVTRFLHYTNLGLTLFRLSGGKTRRTTPTVRLEIDGDVP